MKIALAQINTIVGDIDYNLKKILEYINKAKNENVDLIVFPELTTIGYPPRDLLERQEVIDDNIKALKTIAQHADTIGVICGYAEKNLLSGGKPIHNAAALLYKGKIVSRHFKSLLPDYDVFDERRYFEPAHCVHITEFKGVKLGISICEDMWVYSSLVGKTYKYDPNEILTAYGAEILINLSASPFYYEKPVLRYETIKNAAVTNNKTFVFVNQVCGNDELIFDGYSMVVNGKGEKLALANNFEEDFIIYDTDTNKGDMHSPSEDEIECVYKALLLGIRDYANKCGFKKVILGLSGGIDSALTATLAAKALGSENVVGVLMPGPYSSEGSVTDAEQLAKNLGIQYHIIPIGSVYNSLLDVTKLDGVNNIIDLAEENLQARIRGNIVMFLSNRHNYLVLNTGNKSELSVGYATLYGDMCGGLAVLSDLYKTQVYQLANFINKTENFLIPENTITKAPSAELRPDQKDQDSLPPYDLLDKILKDYIEEGLGFHQLVEKYDKEIVRFILKKVDRSEYKRRQAAPGLKISSKAFGSGRRLPIAQGYSWK